MDDLTALRLQIEWGADEALLDDPVDRLLVVPPARPAALPPPKVTLPPREVEQPAPSSRAAPAERATQLAAGASSLAELRAALAEFDGCALRDTAGHLVFAAGDEAAALLVIGDAPGEAEDRSGTPFAGPAGDYLDRMLASIGLRRDQLLLTPLIPWRPPGNRPPNPAELAVCLPFLYRLIALVRPQRLLLLGPLAAKQLLAPSAARRRQRGAWIDVAIPGVSTVVPALPTFGPAELLRHARDRRAAWADLRLLRRTLNADAARN